MTSPAGASELLRDEIAQEFAAMEQVSSAPVASPSESVSWRKRRRVQPIPKHDWQVELQQPHYAPSRFRKLRLVGLLFVLTGLIAGFLAVALDTPERTPLLIVSDLRPGAIPQSPWLTEEVERLKLLDRTTLTVLEHPPSSSPAAAVAEFRQSLQKLALAANRTGVAIIYFRLPGLIDDTGRPCLVPPVASLVRSEEWLPVELLLEQVASDVFEEKVQRLVIFDRGQPGSVWRAGVLSDSFADQLATLMKHQYQADRWHSIRVLSDTLGRQKGWGSPALGGSVFGEAVWSALAGKANSFDAGGNGDRHVSLSEMADYVVRRTSSWVWTNRGQVQTPTLITADSREVSLFWAAPESRQQEWKAAADRLMTPVDRDSSLHQMKSLWTARRVLDEQSPWRKSPVVWHELNRLLMSYEKLTTGGMSASRRRADVDRAIQSLLEQAGELAKSRPPLGAGEVRLHHRQLEQRLGLNSDGESDPVAALFEQIRRRPDREMARGLLRDLRKKGPVPQDWDLIVLQYLIDDAPDSSWAKPELIARVVGLMQSLGQLQASPDVAVTLMLTPQLQAIEANLRVILDNLFVGSADRLASANSVTTLTERKIADCELCTRSLLKAVEFRDQAAADLPRLAEWIFACGVGAAGPAGARGVEDWIAAMTSWKQLESTLERFSEQGAAVESANLAASLATQMERELSGLWSRVEQTYDRLLNGTTDAAAVTEMEHLLSTALIPRHPDSLSRSPVEQRMTLHEMWHQAATQLAIQYSSAQTKHHLSEVPKIAAPDEWMLQVARGAAPHPMLAMLSLGAETPAAFKDSTESLRERILSKAWGRSALIRHSLDEVPRTLRASQHLSFDSIAARERAWRAQAQRVRAGAYWLPNDLPDNPAHRTEMAFFGRLLRLRAACDLEDFWAGPSNGSLTFCEQAAEDLMDAADLCEMEFRASLSAAGRSDANRIRRELEASKNSASTALRVTAVAVPQILTADALQTDVVVQQDSHGTIPPGTAAVFLGQGDPASEVTVARAGTEIRRGANGVQNAVSNRIRLGADSANEKADAGKGCRAWAWYRGHRYGDDYQLAPTSGLTVRSVPSHDADASVTVQSSRPRPTAILFVLDASASMTDEVPREGTRGTIRKIDAAVEALSSILDDLAGENNIHAGVLFYGHRVAAGENAAAGVMRQPAYQKRFPFPLTLQPYEDVETVLRVGRFGPEQLGQVGERMQALQPWGETPLYLSILEGFEQLKSAPADATRTMVVVTDGLNYQFNPTPEKRTTIDDVLKAIPGNEVAVHLLGFGISDEQIGQARDEFSRISAASGGSSDVTVRDAARLQSYLRSLSQPGRFSIDSGSDRELEQQAQVGKVVVLPRTPGPARSYRVRYESAESGISIQGGEKLTFRPAEDGTLRVVSAIPESTTSLRDRVSGQTTPYELVAWRANFNESGLILRWSLRQRDGHFTPRPAVGEFRIQPLDTRGVERGAAGVCIGPASVSGQPLPTWEFRFPSWPRDAVKVRLEGWVSSDPVLDDRQESCWKLIAQQDKQEAWQAIPLPGVQWQIRRDGRTVTLVERYEAAGCEPQVWTDLSRNSDSGLLTLRNVERRFDAEHRLFVQTWSFDRELTEQDLADLQVHFRSLERIRSQASVTADPLILHTVPDALVIQPAPTSLR